MTEFLLARIAEKERIGRILERSSAGGGTILAECEAVRRIVEEHRNPLGTDWCLRCVESDGTDTPFPCPTVRILAAVYSDHPDHNEAWRA